MRREEYKTEWNDKEYYFNVEYESRKGYVYEDSLKIYLESDVRIDGEQIEVDVTGLVDNDLWKEVFEAMEDIERGRADNPAPFPGYDGD